MTAIDIAFSRTRIAARPLTLVLAAAALGWVAFDGELATHAYKLGKSDHLLRGLHMIPELKAVLGAGTIHERDTAQCDGAAGAGAAAGLKPLSVDR
jgi:hypothetical protein